jgi:hypothetical protein
MSNCGALRDNVHVDETAELSLLVPYSGFCIRDSLEPSTVDSGSGSNRGVAIRLIVGVFEELRVTVFDIEMIKVSM